MIDYMPFWRLMKSSSETWYTLSKKHHVSSSILSRLRHDQDVSLETIDKLCWILHCQPGDLMRYIPSEEDQLL